MRITLNGEAYGCAEGNCLDGLLRELGASERRVALVVNEEVVPLEAARKHRLREGDRVDILTLAGGG